jgi:hypothetical protein
MSQAQNYKVVHVNGDIVAESTHKNIVRGTAFGEKEKFQYKTNDARAVVINAKLGTRFILKGKVSENTFSKANLTPSMGNISSRGGALNNRLDLKNHFDGKYVILGQLEVVINKAVFPMNDTQFFYISYIYNSETINKKLEFHGDTLIINKDSLLKIDGKPIKNEDITQMKLMYYTKNNGKVNLITISDSFYPIFPDENELKSEVDIIINALPKDANKLKPVIDYINEVYGKVNNDNVDMWYQSYCKTHK